jgi:hypothetical protein
MTIVRLELRQDEGRQEDEKRGNGESNGDLHSKPIYRNLQGEFKVPQSTP